MRDLIPDRAGEQEVISQISCNTRFASSERHFTFHNFVTFCFAFVLEWTVSIQGKQ